MTQTEEMTDEQILELSKLLILIKAINESLHAIQPCLDIRDFCEWAFGGSQAHIPMPDAWNAKHGDKYTLVNGDIKAKEDIPVMVRLYKDSLEYTGTIQDE